jgi:hypothetical protein
LGNCILRGGHVDLLLFGRRDTRLVGAVLLIMKESTIEKYFVAQVKAAGGIAYKFTSPAHRGVADRVVCLPDGSTWFVELKAPGGRLSELQKIFQSDMARLRQNYACLWSKEHVDEWINSLAG